MIGIYKITNPFNQVYIGQSLIVERRIISHKSGHNSNPHLTMSIKKHGLHNHKCEVLEECSKDKLLDREKYYLSIYKKSHFLFNYSIYLFSSDDAINMINCPDFGVNELKKIRTERQKIEESVFETNAIVESKEIISEIKRLHGLLKDRRSFHHELKRLTGIGAISISNNWFNGFWAIPEKYQEIVLTKLKEKQ